MVAPLSSVVVVGGGSAGWIVAGTLAARHSANREYGVKITLIESPDVPTVGVGEGTWPTMRGTLKRMGISETDFIRQCDVAFKQGAKFAKWVDGSEDDFYYHPLVMPTGFMQGNLAPFWQLHCPDQSFSEAVCYQEALCEHGLAPKALTTPEYEAVANYAYHLNAGKFAELLKKHCLENLGVEYICDHVVGVNSKENGDIGSLRTAKSGDLKGDLFVDCTGFKSLLLGEHYQVPFVDKSDVLFVDKALAVHVPYENESDEIASHTISTGQRAGWVWDIGLQSRRGVGHVYSSRHTSADQAADDLKAYLAASGVRNPGQLSFREINIHTGHRELFWKNNCVAVGLSSGFLEPLESSALVLVELSAQMLADQLPKNREVMDVIAKRFNDSFLYKWDRVIDFLKLHYILSRREDNDFWIENRDPATIPDSLNELMKLWKYQHPWDYDFTDNCEVFPAASYQYVLYGMGFRTDVTQTRLSSPEINFGTRAIQENQKSIQRVLSLLPKNRDLINKIHQYGFQKI